MKCGDKVEQIIHMKKRLMVTLNWLLKSSHYYKIMQEHWSFNIKSHWWLPKYNFWIYEHEQPKCWPQNKSSGHWVEWCLVFKSYYDM